MTLNPTRGKYYVHKHTKGPIYVACEISHADPNLPRTKTGESATSTGISTQIGNTSKVAKSGPDIQTLELIAVNREQT